MSFTVKGNALSLKELRSGVMERQEVLTELGLEILEISLGILRYLVRPITWHVHYVHSKGWFTI